VLNMLCGQYHRPWWSPSFLARSDADAGMVLPCCPTSPFRRLYAQLYILRFILKHGILLPPAPLSRFVQEVSGDSVWCVFSPLVRGRAFLAHAAAELDQQAERGQQAKQAQQQEGASAQDILQTLFKPGQPIKVGNGSRG